METLRPPYLEHPGVLGDGALRVPTAHDEAFRAHCEAGRRTWSRYIKLLYIQVSTLGQAQNDTWTITHQNIK